MQVSGLRTSRFGQYRQHFPTIDSTQTFAIARAKELYPEGFVATADEQTAGRGRSRGHTWHSPPGLNLYSSTIFRPRGWHHERAPQICSAMGLAVAEALEIHLSMAVDLKWPNDLWVEGRKLGGLLQSSEIDPSGTLTWSVLGMGINVNALETDFPPEVRHRATSLRILSGREMDRGSLFASILNQLEPLYTEILDRGFSRAQSEWNRRSPQGPGKRVHLFEVSVQGESVQRPELEGVSCGISERGALLVRPDGSSNTLEVIEATQNSST